MKRLILILALSATALLAGCRVEQPTLGGTVVSVAEAQLDRREAAPKQYEDPFWPEVGWKIDVRLDNGDEVTVIHNGERRYAPGERVYVLRAEDGKLLL